MMPNSLAASPSCSGSPGCVEHQMHPTAARHRQVHARRRYGPPYVRGKLRDPKLARERVEPCIISLQRRTQMQQSFPFAVLLVRYADLPTPPDPITPDRARELFTKVGRGKRYIV